MAKWTLTSIVGTIVLLLVGGFTLYNSDYKYIITSFPDKEMFIFDYDSGKKVEIITKSSVCPYALFRVSKNGFSAKCGWRRLLDAKWYLEYYKTYGEDEWVRLNRKPRLIELDVSETPDGYLIRKLTPYYATKSKSGFAGNLIETYKVTKDTVKASLEFETYYKNRGWRVIWKTVPNIEVIEDTEDFLKLEKELNIFYDDVLFDYRIENEAFYKVQSGSFKIDPLIKFGNFTATGTMQSFRYGYCDECDNLANVSFSSDSSAFSATYESGWEHSEAKRLKQIDNLTFGCDDEFGGGYCEMSVRNGSYIIPTNDSDTVTWCLFNTSGTSCKGRTGNRSIPGGSGFSYVPGAINNYDGLLINDSDHFWLGVNQSECANWTGDNYTLNFSRGSLDMMVSFK